MYVCGCIWGVYSKSKEGGGYLLCKACVIFSSAAFAVCTTPAAVHHTHVYTPCAQHIHPPCNTHTLPQGTPRTRFLIATTLASLLACILGSLSLPTLVLPVAVISGLAFGACWTLLATLAADLFGIAHLAGNYTVLQLAPALGNILFSTVLAGQLYQVVGRRQGDPVNTCMGKACFGWSLVVSSMACVVAVVCAVVLDRRAASLYAKEYEELHAWDDQES